ncbi:MAG: pyridoxal phosphate-dependent aminotransferase [Fusobacteriota bacterium]
MILSKRVSNIEPSATLDLIKKVKILEGKGEEVVSFGAGEPDFNTPEIVREFAKKAIDNGFTHYTKVSGINKLRENIVKKLKRDNGLDYTKDNILVSNGAKHSLYNTFSAILNPGDEVLLQSPYWVSYPEMIKLVGGKPVFVDTNVDENFKLSVDKLKAKLTSKTKVILINNPNNPTGNTMTEDQLKEIGEFAVENDLIIVSDEIYEKLTYDGEHKSIASISKPIKERTIIINGVSKAYAMTGWRIGYLAAPKNIVNGIISLQGHMTSNPNSIAQKAAQKALELSDGDLKIMIDEFKKRRDYMFSELKKIDKFKLPDKPRGAFYIMPNIEKFGMSSSDFCDYVLEKAKVAIVPGIAFGKDEYVRFSYATSMENIKKGLERLKKLLK